MSNRGIKAGRPARTARAAARKTAVLKEREAFRYAQFLEDVHERPNFGRKLKRAEEKVAELQRLADEWVKNGWQRTASVEGTIRSVWLAQVQAPQEDFDVLAGEAAEALLSSLDQFAYAVAKKANPEQLASRPAASSFPIFKDRPFTKGQHPVPEVAPTHGGSIALWPYQARLDVDAMQPYNHPGGHEASPIWWLRDLANRSKHREIIVVKPAIRDATTQSIGGGITYSYKLYGVPNIGPEPSLFLQEDIRNTLRMPTKFSVDIHFGEGPLVQGRGVVEVLTLIAEYVKRDVMHPLRAYV